MPIYAAALARAGSAASERADAGDTVPGATAGQHEVEATGRTMQVRTRSNVRSGPGMAHDRVEVLDAGTEVHVIGTSGDWVEIVTPGGGNGFIYGPLLAEAAPDRVATASGEEPASSPDTVAEAAAIGAQDIPDAATRERVADWIERCKGGRVHDLGPDCQPVSDQIAASEHGQRCAQLRYSTPGLWGDHGLRMLRDPERALSAMAEHPGRRRKAEEFLRDCVPIYAVALDKAGEEVSSSPSQATAAVERKPEPTIALEPKCTAELPEGSECWQELTERPGCHIWIPNFVYSIVYTDWSGECASGVAEGAGRWRKTLGGSTHIEQLVTFAGGTVIDVGDFEVVDGPSEEAGPPGEAPGTDTPSVDVTSGSGPLHGSIAFSQEDDGAYAWGIAWSYDSSAGAESEAIGQCREYGGTRCAEAGWFQEACGALAIGSGNGHGTGWGATTAEAERDALRQCRAANDDCRIEVARCSRSEEAGGKGRRPEEERVAASASREDDQPVATGPGALCGASEHLFEMEASNHAGCRFCYDSRLELKVNPYWSGSENPRWSGSCANGVANGAGTVTLLGDGSLIYDHEATGAFSAGLPHGHWVETTTYREGNQLLAIHEGTYVEGKREGSWNFRGAVCWEAPFSNDWAFIDESAYFDCE